MTLLSWLTGGGPTPAEIRAEIWNLGVRHRGEPLAGARQELAGHGLGTGREALLKACVRALRSGAPDRTATVTERSW
jgi:hypothetical protein